MRSLSPKYKGFVPLRPESGMAGLPAPTPQVSLTLPQHHVMEEIRSPCPVLDNLNVNSALFFTGYSSTPGVVRSVFVVHKSGFYRTMRAFVPTRL